ncbi:MAG: hypothetical protein GY924_00045 [Planctomycetaceae bacterium]|nr:hypothetical protein [Planctomycetaceae bacterium]
MSQAKPLRQGVALITTNDRLVAAGQTGRAAVHSVVTRAMPGGPTHWKDLAESLQRDVVNYFAHD